MYPIFDLKLPNDYNRVQCINYMYFFHLFYHIRLTKISYIPDLLVYSTQEFSAYLCFHGNFSCTY